MQKLSEIDGVIVLCMFGTGLILLFLYTYEFVRHRTVPSKSPRIFNRLLFCVMTLTGLFMFVRTSPLVGLLLFGLAGLAYWWDRKVVENFLK